MRYTPYLLTLNLLLILALASYVIFQPRQKTGFIYNQKVFEGFKGTQDLKAKLNLKLQQDSRFLDSVGVLIQNGRQDLQPFYEQRAREQAADQKRISDQYTSDTWKRINTYALDFGKAHGYDFIHGASGDGNLMFASESLDITEQVIEYMNRRYETGD